MTGRYLFAVGAGTLLLFSFCSPKPENVSCLSLPVAEPEVKGQQLIHYPEDGQKSGINPPGFTWTAAKDAAGYRLTIFRGSLTDKPYRTLDSLSSTVAVLDSPLETGEYSWCVAYRNSRGNLFGRSNLRKFAVPEGLDTLAMADVSGLARSLAGVRPRIFLLPEEIERIRVAIAEGRVPFWPLCRSLADSALEEPLYPEPAPYKDGKFEVSEWRRIYTPGKVGSAHAVRLALMYKLTGERKYFEGAKKWLLHLATWDPYGITSYNLPQPGGEGGNDEAAMPILERMAMAYDWLADELNEEETAAILKCLKARGGQIMDRYRKIDFLSNPWSNHDGRVLSFFGLAALACLGEFPEAEKWLDYTLRSYLTSYPSWGGDDGGWAQGLSYWSAYLLWHTNFIEALRLATGVNLFKKPFFRNNGFFAVYFHPPYAKRGGFGDHGEGAPGLPEKLLIQRYAVSTRNPVLLWQTENIVVGDSIYSKLQVLPGQVDWKEWFMDDVVAVISSPPLGFEPEPPSALPYSKWLKDIGWAGMHSDLGNAGNDVWALFKASRYGSFSHSHADQNSFQFNAYGEPLIIDSGYYPWYGSPHHVLWTRQTRAHNGILIGGRGQAVFSMEANGKIDYFNESGNLTLVRGDAATAYNVPLDKETVDLWKKNLKEPLPPDKPKVKTARRVLAFCGAKESPWLAVQDYLETETPTTFQYLLHTLQEMDFDQAKGTVAVKRGQVRLKVYLLADSDLSFSKNGKFPIPPEERYAGAPEQWHFSAATTAPKDRVRFLALFVPYREGAEPLKITPLDLGKVRGFSVGEGKVLAWWGDSETGSYEDYGNGGEGRLFIELVENGQKTRYLGE